MHPNILETISRDTFLCFSEKYYLILNCVFYEKKNSIFSPGKVNVFMFLY